MGLFLFFCGKVYIVMYFFCIYKSKRLRIYTIVAFSFIRTFAP